MNGKEWGAAERVLMKTEVQCSKSPPYPTVHTFPSDSTLLNMQLGEEIRLQRIQNPNFRGTGNSNISFPPLIG